MPERRRSTERASAGREVSLDVVRGAVGVAGTAAPAFTLVRLDDAGDTVALAAAADALVLFGHAPPLYEPVVSHGPFLMTTREEIAQAIEDFRDGRLGTLAG
jgi:redox-sensitive bicupin YhaK (pirin superfamily)